MEDYKQLIIARKDLEMSPGKLAVQVSHASMAFLTRQICANATPIYDPYIGQNVGYISNVMYDNGTYESWINGSFTKVLCEAKNRNQLMKAIEYAKAQGLEEGKDFFLIKDNCLTELTPEEPDESLPSGGRTLTSIGFRLLPTQIQREISRHYQLWRNPEKQEEREIAHWEWKQLENEDYEEGICSHCREKITVFGSRPNYCPYCGRKMEEKEADQARNFARGLDDAVGCPEPFMYDA